MADLIDDIAKALVSIVTGDATVQQLLGRSTLCIVDWESLRLVEARPVIAYELVGFTQTGANDDTRDGTIQLDVLDEGNDGATNSDQLLARIELILTWTAFNAASPSVDLAPMRFQRASGGADNQDERRQVRRTLLVDVTACRAA